MKLYVNGQDISRLILADVSDETSLVEFTGEPETFLHALNTFLKDRGKVLGDIEEAYVVVGPGSATSLRTIVTMFNVFAFTHNISLFGLKKKKDEQDIDSLRAIMENRVVFEQTDGRLTPIYESDPKITESKRDALKRPK